jgi:NAD+ synthase (glutamine-hydrolysing)
MKTYGFIKVACASPKTMVSDCNYNTEQIMEQMSIAKDEKSAVLLFPELSITGYTCGDLFFQNTLLSSALESLEKIKVHSQYMDLLTVVGLPIQLNNAIYNVLAVVLNGQLLGLIPKTYLPNYNEFYEQRWFKSSFNLLDEDVNILGEWVPIGNNILFSHTSITNLKIGVEVCEDLWSPIPPSTALSLNGATLILNGSASNDLIGKHQYREQIISTQSAKTISAYLYASCGYGESSTDVVFSGQCLIYENGHLLKENKRFELESSIIYSEIDLDRLTHDRYKMTTFSDTGRAIADQTCREIIFDMTIKNDTITRSFDP